MRLTPRYSPEYLEAAYVRMLPSGATSYRSVKYTLETESPESLCKSRPHSR